jgi:EAL domain-containing protein (putative c-di-GMP-specific phosphodiesterase class I)
VLSRAPAIAELRGLLLERNIALAYDDFGAGQARLLELAEAPPHYLKFDHRFISGLDQAPDAKRRLLQSLLTLARELLVKTVAEGIETAAEARVCAEIGFTARASPGGQTRRSSNVLASTPRFPPREVLGLVASEYG